MPNLQLERMTRVQVGPYVVRVWREALDEDDAFAMHADPAVTTPIAEAGDYWTASRRELLAVLKNVIRALPRLAAFEILYDGQGGIEYPDWK